MDNFVFEGIFFFIVTVSLFFVSQIMMRELYAFLLLFTQNKHIIFWFFALVFLPGTVLHEVSHFIVAVILFLPVGEVRIMPEWHHNQMRFGSVTYGKSDVVRPILVGVAPFFGALFVYWFIGAFRLFPSEYMIINMIMGYFLFTVSATMFSSSQDLREVIYIIPLLMIAGITAYITNIRIRVDFPQIWMEQAVSILQIINIYITINIVIHLFCILLFKSLRLQYKK
ncbi:MAG: hypothetical protein WC489_01565 [Patescibacteria group bacterium]